MYKVKHADTKDESNKPRAYGNTWIEYWENCSAESIPSICPCCGENITSENIAVGAHVVIEGEDKTQYITPTCKRCNDRYKGSNKGKKFLRSLKRC